MGTVQQYTLFPLTGNLKVHLQRQSRGTLADAIIASAARLANMSVLFIVSCDHMRIFNQHTCMEVQLQSSSVYMVNDLSDVIGTQYPDGSFSHRDESNSFTKWLVQGERNGDHASSAALWVHQLAFSSLYACSFRVLLIIPDPISEVVRVHFTSFIYVCCRRS